MKSLVKDNDYETSNNDQNNANENVSNLFYNLINKK